MTPAEWHATAMGLATDYARAQGDLTWEEDQGTSSSLLDACRNGRDAARAALSAHLLAYPVGKPVAHMWQHDETGRTGFVDQWQLDNGWQAANPRLQVISPLYRNPKESA